MICYLGKVRLAGHNSRQTSNGLFWTWYTKFGTLDFITKTWDLLVIFGFVPLCHLPVISVCFLRTNMHLCIELNSYHWGFSRPSEQKQVCNQSVQQREGKTEPLASHTSIAMACACVCLCVSWDCSQWCMGILIRKRLPKCWKHLSPLWSGKWSPHSQGVRKHF